MGINVRAFEFLKLFSNNTTIVVENPPNNLSSHLNQWDARSLYDYNIIGADIKYIQGAIVLSVMVNSDDTRNLFPR